MSKSKQRRNAARMFKSKKRQPQMHMDCLVVGGIADGVLLRKVRIDANVIELGRPTHLKPLESSTQKEPEAGKETQPYQVYTQILDNGDKTPPIQLGVAFPIGMTPWEGFSQIVVHYVQAKTQAILNEQNTVEVKH